jgi:hypothetical protein
MVRSRKATLVKKWPTGLGRGCRAATRDLAWGGGRAYHADYDPVQAVYSSISTRVKNSAGLVA